ncbi:MAG: peptide chain release factor 1 [Myxococcales bacterium]|nr:peptide chain release factor 1 [Myxococcales bacterium]
MFHKLDEVEKRFEELTLSLADPAVLGNSKQLMKLTRERAHLEEIVETYREYRRVRTSLEESEAILRGQDAELRELAEEELPELEARRDELDTALKLLLLPADPNDQKNILLEIRAGTGGEEAALFAADLFRMYSRYAEARGWRVELMSENSTGGGGFKEVIALVSGDRVFSFLKYESGVHRVQRVPTTESQGRIHTSAVTVAILPEAEDIEVQIEDKDLRIDVYRSSGPGGQSVNTTDSAVRVTHVPTGMVVTCQDEKSQHKNKAKALKILQARLFEQLQQEQAAEIGAARKSMVGSGDRSERIRTYNFPQNRLTDHRINLSLYSLDRVVEGDLGELIGALQTHFQTERLKAEFSEP